MPNLLARPQKRRWMPASAAAAVALIVLGCYCNCSRGEGIAESKVQTGSPPLMSRHAFLQASSSLSPLSAQCSASSESSQTCSWADRPLPHDDGDPVQLLTRSLEQLMSGISTLATEQQQLQQQQQQQEQQQDHLDHNHERSDGSLQQGNGITLQAQSAGLSSALPSSSVQATPPTPAFTSLSPKTTTTTTTTSSSPTAAAGTTAASSAKAAHSSQHHQERLIPSYEQWRKRILEKQKGSTEQLERKQRRRKPYQESTIDVAVGEDELGFPFSNLEGSQPRRDRDGSEQDASLARQLGDGSDLSKLAGKGTTWIKAEYAKDPKDRFNHASATCAASVVKANKDAKSINAILNEGKDSYMLYKCDTRDKYFVVELCEEILVDTFVMGNYEFFSSTFKEFVVSVNRYPPRDDGWNVLGHFLARNSRDAQVFKPAVPQLATYIRFDFLSHYGREFYCPITLLRVYGATALEQLKQEEEEEKRQLIEQQRIRESLLAEERAREAKEAKEQEANEDDHHEGGVVSESDEDRNKEKETNGEAESEIPNAHSEQSTTIHGAQVQEVEIHDSASFPPDTSTIARDSTPENGHSSLDNQKSGCAHSSTSYDGDSPSASTPSMDFDEDSPNTSIFVNEGTRTKNDIADDEATLNQEEHSTEQKFITRDEEPTLHVESRETPDTTEPFPPLSPTSPASMQDEPEWHQGDLGVITIPQKAKPSYFPKLSNHKQMGTGQPNLNGGGTPGEANSGHFLPTSSQESVYKNIVNRLKALELNASLSQQYLEEQSNIFNEVLAGLEETSTQLVAHLNEANRRLESLGRKYDQLAYSFKAHLDIDSPRTKADLKDLSSQLHDLAAQVVLQRQLFVITILALCAILAFVAVTRNTTMPYTIVQSPLGSKFMSISGNRRDKFLRRVHSNLTNPALANGSSPAPTAPIPPQASHRNSFSKLSNDLDKRSDDMSEAVYTPPMSPMSPITPMPPTSRLGSEQDSRSDNVLSSSRIENVLRRSRAGSLASLVASAQRLEDSIRESEGGEERCEGGSDTTFNPQLNITTPEQRTRDAFDEYPNDVGHMSQDASPEPPISQGSPQFHAAERFLISRTPYPTPKNSYGAVCNDGGSGSIRDSCHRTLSFQQQASNQEFRSESPSFQMLPSSPGMAIDGVSSSMDAGHLSDADVAYLSRDMNVSRIDSNSPTPLTPIMPSEPRMVVSPVPSYSSSTYATCSGHNPRIASTTRPSTLRNEATFSIQSFTITEHGSNEEDSQPGFSTIHEKLESTTSLLQESALYMGSHQHSVDDHRPDLSLSSSHHDSQDGTAPLVHRFLMDNENQAMHNLEQQVIGQGEGLEEEEDKGFVSDSVIEGSKSDILRSSEEDTKTSRPIPPRQRGYQASTNLMGEWDLRHGVGEAPISSVQDPLPSDAPLATSPISNTSPAIVDAAATSTTSRSEVTSRSKRRSSYSVHRSQPSGSVLQAAHFKNKSTSAMVGLGLGFHAQENRQQLSPPQNRRESEDDHCVLSFSVELSTDDNGIKEAGRKERHADQGVEPESIDGEQAQVVPMFQQSSSTSLSASSSSQDSERSSCRNFGQKRGDEGDDERSPEVDHQ
ncbi:hypothetical protein BGW41_005924 [Actinomortierella wolfii]|nr:hypothetical protein BGW41_005924 [Actinomortierella wolfii]